MINASETRKERKMGDKSEQHNNKVRKPRDLVIPDLRNETEREYQYSKRPYQRDYLRGTEWDREERKEDTTRNTVSQNKQKSRKSNASSTKGRNRKNTKTTEKQPQKKITKNRRKNRKKTTSKIILTVACICAIIMGNIAGRWNAQLDQVLNQRKKGGVDLQEVKVDEGTLNQDSNIINILLVGADKRESWTEAGRSDCTMIATIDKKHKCLKLTSLMRDMYIDIPNHGKDKFNAAYSYGGISLLYQTIAYNFDLHLDGYIIVDFAAFKEVVRKLGGVKVNLTDAEANYLIKAYKKGPEAKVKPGLHKMSARQVLAYVRIRQDAAADFGRTQRQRNVMQAILTEVKTKSITEIMNLTGNLMKYVTTDLSNDEIYSYVKSVVMMGTTTLEQKRIPVDNSFKEERMGTQLVLVPDLTTNKQELQEFLFEYPEESSTNSQKKAD